jgi:hypothetical protein
MKKTLLSEQLRMKQLAGIIVEEKKIEHKVGLIMKLDDSTLSDLNSIEIPTEPNGIPLKSLPNDKKHITLTNIKLFKPFKKIFELPDNIIFPKIILGDAKFVYRNGSDGEIEKVTYVVSIKNQQEIKDFVDDLYKSQDLENPEPNRFFHITIANNFEGEQFKSIGDVTKKDFN